MEAIPLLFDYTADNEYFAEIDNNLGKIEPDEMLLILNFRCARKGMECVVPDCNMPMWTADYEILRGVDFDERIKYNMLLVEYECNFHKGIYEAVTLSKTPFDILREDYGSAI